ncbi:ELOV6 protein, partial [Orthonyx spaldingii]|nr:ELOV6 protein [Orthonyx spaldingii]
FEKNFDHLAAKTWMEENWQKTFTIGSIYLILVFGIKQLMKERSAFNLRTPLTVWSFSLTLFSFIAACRVWKQMAFILLTKGLKRSVCTQSFYVHPLSKLWLYLFALSKLVELGDTLFIVLRKKKLVFVHWYHHLVTMIVCWCGYGNMMIGFGWNAALNLTVHTMTYGYYTVTATGIRVPTAIAMTVTISQMVQMSGFVLMNIAVLFWRDDKLCPVHWLSFALSSVLYITLLALFVNFFMKTYLSGTRKSKGD